VIIIRIKRLSSDGGNQLKRVTVAIIKTTPETVLEVIIGLMDMAGVDESLDRQAATILKDLFMQVVVIAWLLHFYLLIYLFRGN
jgi:cation transport ATPase